MDKILIIGASGVLAKQLAYFLEKLSYQIIGCSRSKISPDNLQYFDVARCDYSLSGLKEVIKTYEPNIVINCAAMINLEQCEENFHECFAAHVELTNKIRVALEKHPDTLFVQISTDNVYGKEGWSKEDEVKLLNNYAKTKYMGDLSARQRENSLVLRTNYLSASINGSSFLDWVIKNVKSDASVTLFGDVLFNPVSSENLATNIDYCYNRGLTGTYNLGSRDAMSKAEVYLEVSQLICAPVTNYEIRGCPQSNVKRPLDMRMCTEKARQARLVIPNLRDTIKSILKGKYDVTI